MLLILLIFLSITFCSCAQENISEKPIQFKIQKTEAEWKEILTPEQFDVARKKGTEKPFTGKYFAHDENGIYHCAACGNPLFSSEDKFECPSGWPSYTKPIEGANVAEFQDNSFGMERTEVVCSKCGAHLGHVFPDGPAPTGLRYCINSISLDFKKK